MFLEKIVDLKPDETQLLYSAEMDNQTIEVRQWEKYRWLHLGDDSVQTLMVLDAPDQIALENVQALLTTLLFCPAAKRLLNLGLGGASLERYLDLRQAGIEVRSVEANEKIIQLAKDYFQLPERIDVIHNSADVFLSMHKEIYDIILCDIFVADTQASCLYDTDFYADVSKCLDKTGVLAINILPEAEEDVLNMLLPIKDHFDHLYLLEFPDYMNAIIFASHRKLMEPAILKTRANDLFKQTQLDLRALPERINILLEAI